MMITKFKLFLENNNPEENVVQITRDDWDRARGNIQVKIEHDMFVDITSEMNKIVLYYDNSDCELHGESKTMENIYLFIDDDYWLYITYTIPEYKIITTSDGYVRFVPQPGVRAWYHKIDISDGYSNMSEYWNILKKLISDND